MATNTYVALDKVTVGTATASITFSSIPSTYTDLVVVASILPSSTSFYTPSLQFNSDTGSNYSGTWIYGQGSSAVSSRNSSQTQMAIDNYSATPAVGYPMSVLFNVFNYANTTTYKTVLSRGNDVFASAGETSATVGLWRSTAAITSVTVKGNGANFAVGSTFSLYGIAAEGAAYASGGYVTSDSQYYYHTFTSSGTFTPARALTCDYLVVAGGGGGGGSSSTATVSSAGGGGAGGLRSTVTATGGGGTLESALSLLSGTAYTVTVGAGGAGTSTAAVGVNGNNSVFSSITSTGGGGGGGYTAGLGSNGVAGGCGGGSAGYNTLALTGGTGTANQGFAGGGSNVSANYHGAGGGGAGAVGVTRTGGAAAGGVGVAVAISGSSVTYAGGGGGGTDSITAGAGGTGGGGAGGQNANGVNGTDNTGGGGGGAGAQGGGGQKTGGNGGSGIVIVRYAK